MYTPLLQATNAIPSHSRSSHPLNFTNTVVAEARRVNTLASMPHPLTLGRSPTRDCDRDRCRYSPLLHGFRSGDRSSRERQRTACEDATALDRLPRGRAGPHRASPVVHWMPIHLEPTPHTSKGLRPAGYQDTCVRGCTSISSKASH